MKGAQGEQNLKLRAKNQRIRQEQSNKRKVPEEKRLLGRFVIAVCLFVVCAQRSCARKKIKANNMAGHRGGNFISSFSSKGTTTSASKPKETSVLDSKNIHRDKID